MATRVPSPERLTRVEAIDLLRSSLMKIAGPDQSLCKVAAERGIFCRGFRRYDDEALRAEYPWLAAREPDMSREELEELGNRWQMARQELHQLPTACDVQSKEHDTCGGWDDFTADELGRFILETTKRQVVVH